MIIFEHNPYNPITRFMVNTCEFDKDAVLLTRKELIKIFINNGFSLIKGKYCLFFPPRLLKDTLVGFPLAVNTILLCKNNNMFVIPELANFVGIMVSYLLKNTISKTRINVSRFKKFALSIGIAYLANSVTLVFVIGFCLLLNHK